MQQTRTPLASRSEPTIQLAISVQVLDKSDRNFLDCSRLALLELSEPVLKEYRQRKAMFDKARRLDPALKYMLFYLFSPNVRILEGNSSFLGADEVRMWTLVPFDEAGYRLIRLGNVGLSVKEDRLAWSAFARKDGANHIFEVGYSCIFGDGVREGLASVRALRPDLTKERK